MPPSESDAELGIGHVPWKSGDAAGSLQALYGHDTEFARVKVRWYLQDASPGRVLMEVDAQHLDLDFAS